MNRLTCAAGVFLAVCIIAGAYLLWPRPVDEWQFNFTPRAVAPPDGFIAIDAGTNYTRWRGYGWLDAAGARVSGRWPDDDVDTWEARDNLSVIARRGPDTLARTFATGPATFAIDLASGIYEVWVLTGDAGHLDYLPRDAYRVVVEGETVYHHDNDPETLRRRFERPADHELLDHNAVWRYSIAPRFVWRRAVVEVTDGQLTVSVEGEKPHDLAPYLGDYAHTEARGGPPQRFAGALNALLVLPYESGDTEQRNREWVAAIDTNRQAEMRARWPQQSATPAGVVTLTSADTARGYTVYPVSVHDHVLPADQRPHQARQGRYRATPGEFVPITFVVSPLSDLGETRVELQLYDAAGQPLPLSDDLDYGVVRYAPLPVEKPGRTWQAGPAMIVPADRHDIRARTARQFWLTYRVPRELPAGEYQGQLTIRPQQGEATQLEVSLQVLPFTLQRPTGLSVGLAYFSPAYAALQGEEAFWSRMAAEFADMRAHNMTTVQYTGIHLDDLPRLGRAMQLYREAGFERPVYLLESHGVMARLQPDHRAWSTRAFRESFAAFIAQFLRQAEARDWPPLVINFGDEFTNRGLEQAGAALARRLRHIPGIVTGADVNGYWELKLLAPEVDILAFNDGWDGPRRVNAGRRLLNAETVAAIRRAGAEPWLVNIGMDRFSNGLWLWKMTRLGVRGKVEWIYRGYAGLPYDHFDAEPLRAHAVYPGTDGASIPSLDYERMRVGLDDLAYLYTLERLIETAQQQPRQQAPAIAAEAYLDELAATIEADIKLHRKPGRGGSKAWSSDDFTRLRDRLIGHIIAIQAARPVPVAASATAGRDY